MRNFIARYWVAAVWASFLWVLAAPLLAAQVSANAPTNETMPVVWLRGDPGCRTLDSFVVVQQYDVSGETWTACAPNLGRQAIVADPQVLTTSWKDAAGNTHTLTTPRLSGEGAPNWAGRHANALKDIQVLFPPVGGGTATNVLPFYRWHVRAYEHRLAA